MSTEPLLKILLISDSKPGHVSQSFGLINVIERIRPVEVTELVVNLRLKILRLLLRYAINKNSPNFIFNDDADDFSKGHKRSYSYVLEYLKEQGHDSDKL